MPTPVSRRVRDEQGATAVLYAILITIVLIPVAALSTDLGNAMSRKTQTQTQADFAALAAAGELNATARPTMTPSPALLAAVAASLNKNQTLGDDRDLNNVGACWRQSPPTCVEVAHLTDTDMTNGDVRFTAEGLKVTSPTAKVNFGLATAFTSGSTKVTSQATVNVFSPGPGVVPMFAVDGCDYGLQTLADPANGHVNPVVPPLADDTHANAMGLDAATLKNSTGAVVESLAPGSTNNVLELDSDKWKDLTTIGFFRGDDTNPLLVESQGSFWNAADATKTALATPFTENSGGSTIALTIPANVSATETVWYVRAYDGVAGKWSARGEAVPIRVGQAVLECGAGSNGGNFGTLRLPRVVGPTADDIPVNIAAGLEDPLNLVVHPQAVADPLLTTCDDGVNGANESDPNPEPDTNCVETDPGFPAGVATDGLVAGRGTHKGLLQDKPTRANCGPNGQSSMRTINVNNTNFTINNDTLTCFLKSGKSIADIVKDDANYTAGVALEEEIFTSPRLIFVPVLRSQPAQGVDTYSIIDFRAAFITDEPATTAAIKGSNLASADNGLRAGTSQGTSKIIQIKVVFFNFKALPVDGDIPLQDYLGVGQPISRLID